MDDRLKRELREIVTDLRKYLQLEKGWGMDLYLRPGLAVGQGKDQANRKRYLLEQLREELVGCKGCRLHQQRKNVVFGHGNPEAQLVFVGEAPGEEEDLQGRPFVGLAGSLLTKIIESIGLSREEVYIANVVKCRPPHNRNPRPDEIEACEPYLRQQLEIIRPKIICALGTFAAQTLLKTNLPISKLRGKFHRYNEIRLMPTFHPAYLLRNPSGKKAVWQDMQLIRRELLNLKA